MRIEKLHDGSVSLERESKADRWPDTAAGWESLTGIKHEQAFLKFDDGQFIGSQCRVYPGIPDFYRVANMRSGPLTEWPGLCGGELAPTARIRWAEADDKERPQTPTAMTFEYFHKHWKLQQWWEGRGGFGEWKDVEVEQ